MARKQPKQIPQMTVAQFEAAFPNEDACDAYLVARRWPNGVICPRCGSDRPYELKTMKFKWECPDCSAGGYRFSNIAGTIFENTNVDLRVWYRVIHLLLTSKKGMSARQIHRYIGFGSYKTAWYMCHRIRAALVEKDFDKLGGVVEVDETFIGGKAYNKHGGRSGGGRGGIGSGKIPVVGAVSRKGSVVARVISTVSILKRGIVGSYHKVSKKYLPLYVAEFQFRYNNRHNPDIFGAAIAVC
jgi:transposase-like protein